MNEQLIAWFETLPHALILRVLPFFLLAAVVHEMGWKIGLLALICWTVGMVHGAIEVHPIPPADE